MKFDCFRVGRTMSPCARYREAMPPGIPKSTKETLGEFPVRVALKERSSRRAHQSIETIEEEAKRQVVRFCEEIVRSKTA